jgi:hypothetical protein
MGAWKNESGGIGNREVSNLRALELISFLCVFCGGMGLIEVVESAAVMGAYRHHIQIAAKCDEGLREEVAISLFSPKPTWKSRLHLSTCTQGR